MRCIVQAKIETIAREMYHASGVEFMPEAEAQVTEIKGMHDCPSSSTLCFMT